MTEQTSKVITVWIPRSLLLTLDEVAKKDDRPRNWEIVQAIKAWVERRKTVEQEQICVS